VSTAILRRFPEGISRTGCDRPPRLRFFPAAAHHSARDPGVTQSPLIHIIDDDDAVRDSLGALLGACGLESVSYPSPLGFLAAPTWGRPGCVVTDVQMPEMTGLELLDRLAERKIALPVIVMTGRAGRDMAAQAVRRGAAAFLDKPFSPHQLLAAVRGAIGG